MNSPQTLRKSDIWVISDTHFNHENILKFSNGRGDHFSDINEMNEKLISNWNDRVKPGDIVYHLGDVFFGNKDKFKKMWPRLNGKKRLIVGNHDDVKFLSSGGFFSKVSMWRMFPEYGCVLTHVPILMQKHDRRKYDFNLHGHVHWNSVVQDNGMCLDNRYRNCCVENTNWEPINLIHECEKLRRKYG